MREILEKLLNNEIKIKEAERILKSNYIKNVEEFAQLDLFRQTRTGIPEVIFAQNKNSELLLNILHSYLEENKFVIISRFTEKQLLLIKEKYEHDKSYNTDINEIGRIIVIREKDFEFKKNKGIVGIITAGTSDIPVAEESKVITKVMGCQIISSYDIGIAGLHRIFKPLSHMIEMNVDVIIVCAGMEGTLPGLVAALVDVPVIGVPISSGYGFGEKGQGALITMLQSCSPGLVVVNIDNGFGAGASASLIANRIRKDL
ncbi:MAG: nickel pincer cofactor biosynthesis protein LarB [Candidatus Lokiarchaeota archaeon]|nr:nickel pincer cofactor biosynthesis protein LarB [Candidatus Lokiarchaeota archaeon]